MEPPPWTRLWQILEEGGGVSPEADGAAAAHSRQAREEIVRKLIGNHEKVLNDLTNSAPLTQHELTRLPGVYANHVDLALRESIRRLIGRRPGVPDLEHRMEPLTPCQAAVWTGVCNYLDGRIQMSPDEKPGRNPDMSVAAASAWRAVLYELGGHKVEVGHDLRWSWPQAA